MTLTAPVGSGVADRFREDGVVHLPQLLHPEWLELISRGIERNLRNPGPYGRRLYADTPREHYLDYLNYDAVPEYQNLLAESPIVDVVAEVLGTERLWLFFEQLWIKEPGADRRTPWHQDATYWITGGEQVAGFWITLDPLGAEESLEFVRGSHLGPLYGGTQLDHAPDDDTAPLYDEWPRLPDIQADRAAWDIVSFPNQPGDVVMFHPATLHGGGAGSGGRRTLSLRFFGDDVVYAPRPGRPSPSFPGVALTLEPGAPLRSWWFPQVRPRPGRSGR